MTACQSRTMWLDPPTTAPPQRPHFTRSHRNGRVRPPVGPEASSPTSRAGRDAAHLPWVSPNLTGRCRCWPCHSSSMLPPRLQSTLCGVVVNVPDISVRVRRHRHSVFGLPVLRFRVVPDAQRGRGSPPVYRGWQRRACRSGNLSRSRPSSRSPS